MYCSSDTVTDEDKEATIKNGRGVFSVLWARARRKARNGEKERPGSSQAMGGRIGTGQVFQLVRVL